MRSLSALALLLTVCLCLAAGLSGCSDAERIHERYEPLHAAAGAFSSHTRRSTRFQAEAVFRGTGANGTGSILYSVNGTARCDETEQWAHQAYTAVWLGLSSRGEDLFRSDRCVHKENGEETVSDRNTAEVLGTFPFRGLWIPDESDVTEIAVSDGMSGTLYTVKVAGNADLLKDLSGMDWYALTQIAEPDLSREKIGPLTLTYTVSDGQVRSFAAECALTVYEKAGYTPGYSNPDADGLELTVRVQWTAEALDGDVPGPEDA
ncbi:MAG: hypothetical protein J5843_03640 [Clostridia bacterium]|nr:hypothetical protein [Clostridia bacterium]